MLVICKNEVEKTYAVSLKQEDIEVATITKNILAIYNTYAVDKRYTKKLCVNSNRLTLCGLRKFDTNEYVKIPMITVSKDDRILAGLTFTAEEYVFVKEAQYLKMCKKCFKDVINSVITVLDNIMSRNLSRRDFDYTKRDLALLLTDIDALKQIKD